MSVQKLPHIALSEATLSEFCSRNHIRQLLVFGSVLRDDFTLDSDIDVLVDFTPDANIGLMGLSRIQRELSALLGGRAVDITPIGGISKFIRQSVLSSAKVWYERQSA